MLKTGSDQPNRKDRSEPVLSNRLCAAVASLQEHSLRAAPSVRTTKRHTFALHPAKVMAASALPQSNHLRTPVWPNPSVNLTRYGRPCKPGPRQSYYRCEPGLQGLPTRAGYLER